MYVVIWEVIRSCNIGIPFADFFFTKTNILEHNNILEHTKRPLALFRALRCFFEEYDDTLEANMFNFPETFSSFPEYFNISQ